MKDFCLNMASGDYYALLKDLRRYILIYLCRKEMPNR